MSRLFLSHFFAADVPEVWQLRVRALAERSHAALGRWGAWAQPVALHWLEQRAELQPAHGAPFAVRALASATVLQLWSPWRWPEPPADPQLARLLGHELAHAWWLQRTQSSHQVELPLWLCEGWGVLLAPHTPPPLPPHLSPAERLALAHGGPAQLADQPDAVYAVAEALCTQLVHELGRRGLTALQRGLQAGLDHRAALRQAGLSDADRWLTTALAKP